jgi:hypothetical protein
MSKLNLSVMFPLLAKSSFLTRKTAKCALSKFKQVSPKRALLGVTGLFQACRILMTTQGDSVEC